MPIDGEITVEIFFASLEQRSRAFQVFETAGEPNPRLFDGSVEGSVPEANFEIVVEGASTFGLTYDLPHSGMEAGAGLLIDNPEQHLFPNASPNDEVEAEILEQMKRQATEQVSDRRQLSLGTRLRSIMGSALQATDVDLALGKSFPGLVTIALDSLSSRTSISTESGVYRIGLKGPINDRWKAELEAAGATPLRFEAQDVFDTIIERKALEWIKGLPFVAAMAEYGVAETIAPNVREAFVASEKSRQENTPLQPRADSEPGVAADATAMAAPTGVEAEVKVFDIVVHRQTDQKRIQGIVARYPHSKVLGNTDLVIRAIIPLDSELLSALAGMAEIRSISLYEPPKLFLDNARKLIGVEREDAGVVAAAVTWDGSGQTVAVIDSGVDTSHADLADVEAFAFGRGEKDDREGHGTHVAGIIGGKGLASNSVVRGVAPGAKILSVGIVTSDGELDIPIEFSELLDFAYDKGARIINISLGWDHRGAHLYETVGRSIDQYTRDHPDLLVVVAAGNSGRATNGFLDYKTIGQPASTKNVLTVGASCSGRTDDRTWSQYDQGRFAGAPIGISRVDQRDDIAAISCTGPTNSNFTKPDMVAPGFGIYSARARNSKISLKNPPRGEPFDENYLVLNGSSMAAPMVSGAAALIRQFLVEELMMPEPSAALIKAILIAGVKRLSPHLATLHPDEVGYPDFAQGFGRLDIGLLFGDESTGQPRKFHVIDVKNASPEALSAKQPFGSARNSSRFYKFTVPEGNTDPIKACVAWTDPPGSGLQNNIDLILRMPSGKAISGNGEQLAFRPRFGVGINHFDKHNNVELIAVDEPVPGDYSLQVVIRANSAPPQGYGLCIAGGQIAEVNTGAF